MTLAFVGTSERERALKRKEHDPKEVTDLSTSHNTTVFENMRFTLTCSTMEALVPVLEKLS